MPHSTFQRIMPTPPSGSRRPDHETSGYAKASWAENNTINLEGAVGGSLIDGVLAARLSVLHRTRDNWITNAYTGEESLGEYDENAMRLQMLWTPTDRFSALLIHQNRNLEGTSSIFRANDAEPDLGFRECDSQFDHVLPGR